jgi:hypothetical protein
MYEFQTDIKFMSLSISKMDIPHLIITSLFSIFFSVMDKFAGILCILLQCSAIFAEQESEMPTDFLMTFVESFHMANIMIIRNSSGECVLGNG